MVKNLESKFLFILFAIFALALFLRFYHLPSVPNGMHIDEASLGYNAYSLLHTGRDENGQAFPLYVNMFGDYRPSGYHIIDIVPVALFGLNIFATRFPAALFGSLLIFPLYFLGVTLFGDRKVGLIAALLAAISPWSMVISRASGEAIIALFFITLGFVFLIKSVEKHNPKNVVVGTLLVAISFFFYHTPRVFVPLFFFVLFAALYPLWRKSNKKYKTTLIVSFILMSLISFTLVFLINGGAGRFSQVNIFGFPETKLVMNEQLREDGVMGSTVLLSRLFHNKLEAYFLTFAQNYLEYFSGEFLFIKGGLPAWYIVPWMGLLYIVEIPFLLLGVIQAVISKNLLAKIPLVWLIIAPVTAAITVDDVPNVNRAIVMLPALELLVAYGFIMAIKQLTPRFRTIGILIISVLFVYNVSYFLHQYFVNAQIHKNWYRNEGFEKMGEIVKDNYNSYDKIIVTKSLGGIYPLILFYTQFDPKAYQLEGSVKDADYKGFGKFFFVPQACPATSRDDRFPKDKKILYVEKGECMGGKKAEYINRLDGTPVFHIVYE